MKCMDLWKLYTNRLSMKITTRMVEFSVLKISNPVDNSGKLENVYELNPQPKEQYSFENLIFHLYFNFRWFFCIIYHKRFVETKPKITCSSIFNHSVDTSYLIHFINKETILCGSFCILYTVFITSAATSLH